MRRTGLERAIDEAVAEFTEFVVDAVRSMPLDELSRLRGERLMIEPPTPAPPERANAPTRRPKRRPPAASTFGPTTKQHPRCAYPGCGRNRFVRGRGFCGPHWKKWKRGEIENAEVYMNAPETVRPTAKETPREREPSKRKRVRAAVVEFLVQHPEADAHMISMKLGLPIKTVERHLGDLVDNGKSE